MAKKAKSKAKAKAKEPKRYPLLEWSAAAVGLLITAVMFGLLAYEAAKQEERLPAIFEVQPTSALEANGQFIVQVEIRNRSRNTAASVQVEGTLASGSATVETSSATVDYIPGESTRRAAVIFSRDPRAHRLDLRVIGYTRP